MKHNRPMEPGLRSLFIHVYSCQIFPVSSDQNQQDTSLTGVGLWQLCA